MYIVKCIQILQFYARVVVELELQYVQRPLLASGSELAAIFHWRAGASQPSQLAAMFLQV